MKQLITKYLDGEASEAEQMELLLWLRNKENRLAFNSQKLDWKKSLDKKKLPEGSENSWNLIQTQLLQKSYNGWQSSRKMNQLFRYAAILFFVLSLGSAVYFISERGTEKVTSEYFTKVVAENGYISKIVLPDGSIAWLNSDSEIEYSNLFAANNRNIKLTGEAYFQITRNEHIPLIVNTGELQVKVLGTKFNVEANPEADDINVVLETGKVELLNREVESFQYYMKPGELASFNKKNRELSVITVNTVKYTSWKDGIINIYNQPLEEVVKRLEDRYNQKFEYARGLKSYHFTFTIKNEPLKEIIELMEKIAPIKTEQKENIIEFELDEKRERAVGVN